MLAILLKLCFNQVMTEITREEALSAFHGNVAALAHFLNISVQAIYLWPIGEPIPKLRQYELCDRMPHYFGQFKRVKRKNGLARSSSAT